MNAGYEISTLPPNKVGLISFTDPRKNVKLVAEREQFIQKQHNLIVEELRKEGFVIIDPLNKRKKNGIIWGVSNHNELPEIIAALQKEELFSLLFGCFSWNEPDVPLALATSLELPIALLTTTSREWPGVTALTSTGASFWENSRTAFIKKHERFAFRQPREIKRLLPWLRAMRALRHLKTGEFLLWGGSPALHMEHLNDDIPTLKRLLVKDITSIGQYELILKQEEILEKTPERIMRFKKWLEEKEVQILFDNKMITNDTLTKEIALYFAAKDAIYERLQSGQRIIGISIKCQPELSVQFGITPCFLPAFLPFPADSEEPQKVIIPTVCEGDIKGLITSALLFGLNPVCPPLFGDIKSLEQSYFVLSNCGAASVFYSQLSSKVEDNLTKISLKPQCQGAAGAAVHFQTPATQEKVTFARLIRLDGQYIFQVGVGKIVEGKTPTEEQWGSSWPYTAITLPLKEDLFVKVIGTNHLSLTLGDFSREFLYLSKMLAIPVLNLNNEQAVEQFLAEI